MRQVLLQEFVSLDGLAAGPNASVDFVPAATKDDRSFEQYQLRFAETIDTILLGELTFQESRSFDRGEVALKYIRSGH